MFEMAEMAKIAKMANMAEMAEITEMDEVVERRKNDWQRRRLQHNQFFEAPAAHWAHLAVKGGNNSTAWATKNLRTIFWGSIPRAIH